MRCVYCGAECRGVNQHPRARGICPRCVRRVKAAKVNGIAPFMTNPSPANRAFTFEGVRWFSYLDTWRPDRCHQ